MSKLKLTTTDVAIALFFDSSPAPNLKHLLRPEAG